MSTASEVVGVPIPEQAGGVPNRQLPEPAVAQARQQGLDRDHLLRSALSAVANSPEPAHGLRISSGTSMSSSG